MTVVITGADKAIEAAEWCDKNIGSDNWALKADYDIFSSKYHFQFEYQEDATHFALKWR